MVTLGLICIFVSFILVIMGLLAWGSVQPEQPEAEPPEADTPPAPEVIEAAGEDAREQA